MIRRTSKTSSGRHAAAYLAAAFAVCMTLSVGCGGKKGAAEPAAFLTPEERYESAIEQLSRRQLRQALDEFGRVDQYAAENRSQLEPLVRLGMADATFYQLSGISLIDARAMYLDFVTLYGDHPRAPYAQFQAGICSLKQVNDPSRDQAQTLQAIEDLRQVGQRYPASAYATAARVMLGFAEENLAEHEYIVGKFYAKRKQPVAAGERFRRILDRFPSYRERDKVYLALGRALLQAGNHAEAQIYLSKLLEDYPGGRYTDDATKLLAEADAGRREAEDGAP